MTPPWIKDRLGRQDIPWLLLLSALAVVVCWPLVGQGQLPLHADNINVNLPRHVFLHHHFFRGLLPLWDPQVGAGAPTDIFLAPTWPFYPFNLPFYLIPDPLDSFRFSFLGMFLMLGWVFYVSARLSFTGSRFAAALGAVLFMLSGYAQVNFDHPQDLPPLAWAPLVLAGALNWLATRKPLWLFVMAGAVGLQFMGFNLQWDLMTCLMTLALWAAWGWVRRDQRLSGLPGQPGQALVGLLGAWGVGALSAAIVLLPFMLGGMGAERAAWHWRWNVGFPMGPPHVLASLYPNLFGSFFSNTHWANGAYWGESTGYVGFAALTLVLYSARRRLGRPAVAFLLIALLGLVISFGARTPVGLVVFNLPLFHAFAHPGRFFFVMTCALSVAVAMAGETLTEEKQPPGVLARWVMGLALLSALLLLVLRGPMENLFLDLLHRAYAGEGFGFLAKLFLQGRAEHDWAFYAAKSSGIFRTVATAVAAGHGVLGAAIALGYLGREQARTKQALWLGLMAVSLLIPMGHFTTNHPAALLRREPDYLRVAKQHLHGGRFLPSLQAKNDLSLPWREELNTIFDVPLAKAYLHFHAANNTLPPGEFCQLYGVRVLTQFSVSNPPAPYCAAQHLLATVRSADATGKPTGSLRLYSVKNPLPVAYLAPTVRTYPATLSPSGVLRGQPLNPRLTVLLPKADATGLDGLLEENASPPEAIDPQNGVTGFRRPLTHQMRLSVKAPQTTLLVVLENWDQGWRATVDGKPAPIRRAFGAFMALRVPAGQHRVALDYFPWHWPWLPLFCGGVWLGILLGGAGCWLTNQRLSPPAAGVSWPTP